MLLDVLFRRPMASRISDVGNHLYLSNHCLSLCSRETLFSARSSEILVCSSNSALRFSRSFLISVMFLLFSSSLFASSNSLEARVRVVVKELRNDLGSATNRYLFPLT